MKPGGSKSKGKKYEDLIAKLLHSKFYEECETYKELFDSVGNDDLKPQRDSSSGTFERADGDIELNLLKKFFPMSIECKHRKDLNINLNQILKHDANELKQIFKKQAIPNAERKNLTPVIFFKSNYTDNFVYCEKNLLDELPQKCVILGDKVILLLEDFLNSFIKKL